MEILTLLKKMKQDELNLLHSIKLGDSLNVEIYPNSIHYIEDDVLFIAKLQHQKYLWILATTFPVVEFEGEFVAKLEDNYRIRQCPMNHHNAEILRQNFEFTKPVLIGSKNSFGLGDRIGIAGPAHIRAIVNSGMKPILAQQSIRELQRTQRTPEEVMDAASWAAFQEGYANGFGSDADHIKTEDDIDLMLKAGFTMFTIDPGDYVDNEADNYSNAELNQKFNRINWDALNDSSTQALQRYESINVKLTESDALIPQKLDVQKAFVKYGAAIANTYKLYQHLKHHKKDDNFELEISVDETESVTTPFEHYFMANELIRLGVKFVSLAPRFIGDFEKGIDYKGDLKLFKQEYQKHLAITQMMGGYKISLHSGSDKFSVYRVIGSLRHDGNVHIKTAGTSYLEALRTVAKNDADLFRQILDFSAEIYPTEKATYHVSADITRVPKGKDCNVQQLLALFEQNDTRQVLHVAFGKVLTTKTNDGTFLFRDKILNCLIENEQDHYNFLTKHIKKHIQNYNLE